MKRLLISLTVLLTALPMAAQTVQGWPANYGGVMLQAFSWDDFDSSQWTVLEKQADELAPYFSLVWIPQSGNCDQKSMGYDDFYWFPGGNHYNSSFGTEEQLRSLISTFKAKGIGTIADVVINHRKSNNGWFGFPTETYKGITYSMSSEDVCSNDDGGKAKSNNPTATLGNADTGEDWDGMRDLDHTSTNVQNTVKAYLDMLLNDLGYIGFRYDMVKGYAPQYTKMYNESVNPQFSIGECWDSSYTIEQWIDGTGGTSAAFDFQFKYVVRNAADGNNYGKLNQYNNDQPLVYGGKKYNNYPLISNKDILVDNTEERESPYKQFAITFVENHDTQKRPDGSSNGPLNRDTVTYNAYMLGMPGTPCVFLPHWIDYKQEIKSQIMARQLAGIVNTSSYEVLKSNAYNQVVSTTGNNAKLLTVIGIQSRYTPEDNWVKVLEGKKYSYWVDRSLNTAWISHASGTYEVEEGGQLKVMLSAVANTNAQLVYTTDGSEPTANSTKAVNGDELQIPVGTTTLKVGLLINGVVSAVQTRTYIVKEPYVFHIPDFCTVADGEICAFFEAPQSWSSDISCWAWDNNNYTGGTWPGIKCTKLGVADSGNDVWKWSFKTSDYTPGSYAGTMPQYIIFNNSNNGKQTANLDFVNGGYYNKDGLLGTVTTGISTVTIDRSVSGKVYTLDGRVVNSNGSLDNLARGIYVVGGRKFVIK